MTFGMECQGADKYEGDSESSGWGDRKGENRGPVRMGGRGMPRLVDAKGGGERVGKAMRRDAKARKSRQSWVKVVLGGTHKGVGGRR